MKIIKSSVKLDANLKNINGESQKDVQNRMHTKIKEIFVKNDNKKVAIVCHNACILFYLLKFCKLEKAELNKNVQLILSTGDEVKASIAYISEQESKNTLIVFKIVD